MHRDKCDKSEGSGTAPAAMAVSGADSYPHSWNDGLPEPRG